MGWYEAAEAAYEELQPGHCDFSRAHDDDPHLKEDCGDPDTWEPEYDGPADDEWINRAYEAQFPKRYYDKWGNELPPGYEDQAV